MPNLTQKTLGKDYLIFVSHSLTNSSIISIPAPSLSSHHFCIFVRGADQLGSVILLPGLGGFSKGELVFAAEMMVARTEGAAQGGRIRAAP